MSNSVLPSVAPTRSPRRTISIASVTMKAFSFSFTIRKPLNAPITAPTTRITAMPAKAGHCVPKPDGMTSSAPTAGAMPTVDSSDRSNLPEISTSDSPSTTSASAADAPRMLIRLPVVRKLSLTIAPMTSSTASAGSNASSRSLGSRAARRATDGVAVRSPGRTSVMRDPFDVGHQVADRPAGVVLRDQGAGPQHQHPVARPQVVQLVADDQDRLAFRAHPLDLAEQRLLRLHVDPGGRVDQHQHVRVTRERPRQHHLLLVAAGQRVG